MSVAHWTAHGLPGIKGCRANKGIGQFEPRMIELRRYARKP